MEQELANQEMLGAFLATSAGIFIFSLLILWSSVWSDCALEGCKKRGCSLVCDLTSLEYCWYS